MDCKQVTNYYDAMMGRLCPKCTAIRCARFGKNLTLQNNWKQLGLFNYPDDMKYLAYSNRDLLVMPLVDHSNDIEAHLQRTE